MPDSLSKDKNNQSSEQGDKLLNGPQLPDKTIKQEDIDKLLAEFD